MAMKERIDTLLRGAVGRDEVPGVVAMATDRKAPVYRGGFGSRVLGQDGAMDPDDTVVWIASLSKALTGAAAMREVQEGRLSLDAPASSVLPGLGDVQVLEGFDDAGKPVLRAPRSPVTLRQLLTHTAGFAYDMWSEDIVRYQQATDTPGIISCQLAALGTPLIADPGTRWEYGTNIDWAGRMVEATSGMKIGAYLRRHLFEPLGMQDTAFRITPSMRTRLAKIHQRTEEGGLVPLPDLELPQEPEFEMGGGGLYGTVADYAKFIRMMLNEGRADDGTQVLAPATVAMMSRPAIADPSVRPFDRPMKSAIPSLSNDVDLFPGIRKSWGLSFLINEEPLPTGRSAGSLAWAGLANAYYWIDPARGVGGVYATQILPFADVKAWPLYLEFEKAVYDTL